MPLHWQLSIIILLPNQDIEYDLDTSDPSFCFLIYTNSHWKSWKEDFVKYLMGIYHHKKQFSVAAELLPNTYTHKPSDGKGRIASF